MAPVNGKPFLDYVISYFQGEGFTDFIFSLGYKHEIIETHLSNNYPELRVQLSVEENPLGTGGAIKKACKLAAEKNIFITNGDTLFKAGTTALLDLHQQKNADCTLALKPMKHFDRYGVIDLNEDGSINSFNEKKYYEKGLINGGLYLLNVASFLKEPFPSAFSFETAYLEKYYQQHKMFGLIQDKYFIDIGIPEDYARAGREL
jgi:D-glycero-alpha-D-manno-heptose 1-phosphate guanylyltransferase